VVVGSWACWVRFVFSMGRVRGTRELGSFCNFDVVAGGWVEFRDPGGRLYSPWSCNVVSGLRIRDRRAGGGGEPSHAAEMRGDALERIS
jgi:hypothetical protein